VANIVIRFKPAGLEDLRRSLGVDSDTALAAKIEFDRSTLGHIKAGRRRLSEPVLAKMIYEVKRRDPHLGFDDFFEVVLERRRVS
jgi:hypothetical protein